VFKRSTDQSKCRPITISPSEDQGGGEVQSERPCPFSEIGVNGMVNLPMLESSRQPLKVIKQVGSGVNECRMLNIAWPLHKSILRDES